MASLRLPLSGWLLLLVLLSPPTAELPFALLGASLLLAYRFGSHSLHLGEVREAFRATAFLAPLAVLEAFQILSPFPLLREERVPYLPLTAVGLLLVVYALLGGRESAPPWSLLALLTALLGGLEVLSGVAFYPWPSLKEGVGQIPTSLFGGRGFWSAFLLLALPFLLEEKRRLWAGVAVSFFLGMGTVRPALLGVVSSGFLMGRGVRQKAVLPLVLGLAFAGGFWVGVEAPALRGGQGSSSLEEHLQRNTLGTRLTIWEGVLRDLRWRPLLGWYGQPASGLYPHFFTAEEFARFYEREFGMPFSERGYYVWCPAPGRTWGFALKEEGEEGPIYALPPLPAHNLLLHFLGGYGVLGGAYFALLYAIGAWRARKTPWGAALFSLLPHALFWHPNPKVLFFLFLVLEGALRQEKASAD